MTIAQHSHRLLAIVLFFTFLAILLLAVVWFEGSQLFNIYWHTVHSLAVGHLMDGLSRHP
jgi:succinate dehydrogenase/fumarate reductase cytochrome b subunit